MNSTKPSLFASNRGTLQQRRYARYQRGASLLEGIAYLGIAAIVVLGAVSLLTGAFSSAKSNQANEEIVALRTAARKLYMGQTYPAAMLPNLVAANAVPATLVRGADGAITNSWGGAVTVVGTNDTFTITYNALPKDVCMGVVSGANGWVSIGEIVEFPATADNAATVCAADTNIVAFVAR